MKESDYMNKAVVSIADGLQVGTVKDLVFQDMNLAALRLQGESGEGVLPFRSLEENGPDVITIQSLGVVDWSPAIPMMPNQRSVHELRKLSVVDSDGKALGTIHDFTIDETGRIQELDVRTEGVFGVGAHKTKIEGDQVCAIGAELMTVKAVRPTAC